MALNIYSKIVAVTVLQKQLSFIKGICLTNGRVGHPSGFFDILNSPKQDPQHHLIYDIHFENSARVLLA